VNRRVAAAIRLVATAAMLVFLVSRIDIDSLLPSRRAATFLWLGASMAVTLSAILLAAVRWHRVLAALDLRAGMKRLFSTYLACQFVCNFLPTTIAGDVLRVSRIAADNGETPRTFASVVLERLTGWVVLPLITLGALALNPTLLHLPNGSRADRLTLIVSFGTLALLALVLYAAGHPSIGGRLSSTAGWRRFTGAIHLGVNRLRHHPAAALEALFAGLGYQLAIVLAAFMAAKALEIPIGWTAVMAFIPVVAIVQVLPFPTVGGLGIREGALVVLLTPLGVSQSQAIALGLMMYGINLVVSLLGAPAFAIGRRPVMHA
jgi:uncharacterized membrane protein YbhN (UPF0104 family)